MITRKQIKGPKKRILTVCVRMFIEKGFKATTMPDIIREADVSSGTFQNIFRTKDGALMELIHFMFDNQFGAARRILAGKQNPVLVYAAETAIQMVITESNDNLREIYVEAYTQPQLAEYIYEKMSTELCKIFGELNPGWADSDFYESEIGSAGMMRAFMARRCDKYFTLRKKIRRFLDMSLKTYNVPEALREEAAGFVETMNPEQTTKDVLEKLFASPEITFGFQFSFNEKKED